MQGPKFKYIHCKFSTIIGSEFLMLSLFLSL